MCVVLSYSQPLLSGIVRPSCNDFAVPGGGPGLFSRGDLDVDTDCAEHIYGAVAGGRKRSVVHTIVKGVRDEAYARAKEAGIPMSGTLTRERSGRYWSVLMDGTNCKAN